MQTNLQTTVTDTLTLVTSTRQVVAASTKLFGHLDKDARDTLILLLSLACLAYCAIQYLNPRR